MLCLPPLWVCHHFLTTFSIPSYHKGCCNCCPTGPRLASSLLCASLETSTHLMRWQSFQAALMRAWMSVRWLLVSRAHTYVVISGCVLCQVLRHSCAQLRVFFIQHKVSYCCIVHVSVAILKRTATRGAMTDVARYNGAHASQFDMLQVL